jgi:hypothetical protein
MNERWLLKFGDALVGSIDVTGTDQPWFTGHFYPEPGFAEFGDLFKRELALVEGNLDRDIAQWEEVYGRIRNRLCLLKPNGTVVPEYLLHIDGEDAWCRYSDESFEGV